MPGAKVQSRKRKGLSNSETPEIVRVGVTTEDRESWAPVVGKETYDLLSTLQLPADAKAEITTRLKAEAIRIFSRCVPPNSLNSAETGLVVGYVQSGKTMSFTTVAALARDNDYQMVIVIAGTSVALLRQSAERLFTDLRLGARRDRSWQYFQNPTLSSSDERNISATLEDWDDPDVPRNDRRTVLITVMKQHSHLQKLNNLLAQLPMSRRPVLVIDDEADQAGLNAGVRKQEVTTTYAKLIELRSLLPTHSYLQYTATPQAPLLINLIDILSPRFAEILQPGPGYVGGRDFFASDKKLVRVIPDKEIPSAKAELDEPFDSLLDALRAFFLGVAAGSILDGAEGNRSMMVHPSQRTDSHETYLRWVRAITTEWQSILGSPSKSRDRKELIEDFKETYKDLQKTALDIPAFPLLEAKLKYVIRRTRVEEINARDQQTPEIDWGAAYAHILVGGQAMDRGFTVEGLTVTYMPRSLGVGNADTVQQRARFFGYKLRYLGYCRVYLEGKAAAAYKKYVLHEEDVRARLIAHANSGRPLADWKREFFLTKDLKPTRQSVLGFDYMRLKLAGDWWNPEQPGLVQNAVDQNSLLCAQFLSALRLRNDAGHRDRTEAMRHQVDDNVPLADLFENFLTRYRVIAPQDSSHLTALLLVLQDYIEKNPHARSSVYWISGGRLRKRTVDDMGRIETLAQGPHPDKQGKVYPGDRAIRASDKVTVQIHNVTLLRNKKPIAEQVPVIAIWIPEEIAPDRVIQDQPHLPHKANVR